MRRETGNCPQAPSNRPLQPVKRQGNIKLGQLRKLCLYGGVLPRAIEHRPPRSTFSIFSRSVFSTPSYFQGRPNFGVLRRFMGALWPRPTSCPRLRVARNRAVSRVSVISGSGLWHPDDQKDTTRPPPTHGGVLRDSFVTLSAVARWRCPRTRRIASKLV